MRFQPAFFVLAASLFTGIQASHNAYSSHDDSLKILTELGKRWLEARHLGGNVGVFSYPGGPGSPDFGARSIFGGQHPHDSYYGHGVTRQHGRPHGQDMSYTGGNPGFYAPGGRGHTSHGGPGKREVDDDEDDDDEDEIETRDLPEPTQMQFQLAIKLVKNLKSNLTESERISLWSLYQQATLGDVNEAKEKAKLEAWKAKSHLSKDEAKSKFNSLAFALHKNITSPTTTTSTKSATTATVTVTHVPTVAPSTKQLWNMYSPPQNFNEPEFVKYNKIAENLHDKFNEDEKLKLYGLYKQSILGDNRVGRVEDAGKELGGYKPKERWQKWEDFKGKNKDEARREYVDFVKELENKYKQ